MLELKQVIDMNFKDDKIFKSMSKFQEDKCEMGIFVKPSKIKHYEYIGAKRNKDEIVRFSSQLEKDNHKVKIILKTIGNKHTACYLTRLENGIYITEGKNRTIELISKELSRSKNNPSKSGYMGFAFHYPTSTIVSTRMYDTKEEAEYQIIKNHKRKEGLLIKEDSIEIIDVTKLNDNKFYFSDKKYENKHKVTELKEAKLILEIGETNAKSVKKFKELIKHKNQTDIDLKLL